MAQAHVLSIFIHHPFGDILEVWANKHFFVILMFEGLARCSFSIASAMLFTSGYYLQADWKSILIYQFLESRQLVLDGPQKHS